MKKGFTFIELMGVLIILGIIGIVTTPIIIDSIEESKRNTFNFAANAMVESINEYYQKEKAANGILKEDLHFSLSDEQSKNELGLLDSDINLGTIAITKDGEVSFQVSDGTWCAEKEQNSTRVIISKGTDCLS